MELPVELTRLVAQWRSRANGLEIRSNATWEALGKGTIPQDDFWIYSVYQDQSQADGLNFAADELEQLIKDLK